MEKISLDKFLTETVGMLGVIPADEYLETAGWKLNVDGQKEYSLLKISPSKKIQKTALSTNLSAADVVAYCYEIGLVKRPTLARNNTSATGLAMAFAAHLNQPKLSKVVHKTQSTGASAEKNDSTEEVRNHNHPKEGFTDHPQVTSQEEPKKACTDPSVSSTAAYAENLSIETATADVQRALEDYPDQYPYNFHFHPAVDQPILAFDPALIQDDFDPFDLRDFINFDS
jgi:Mating-type protein MAT alpha 1 HMG-box